MKNIFFTLLIGTAGGILGLLSGFPAGVLVGSMLAVGISNCIGFKANMPVQFRVCGQVVIGCLLGLNLNPESIAELSTVWAPALTIVLALLLSGFITGFLVHKICKVDIPTAILSSSAGGLTELSVLAVSLGVDGPKVAIVHLVRILTVITTMPILITLLERLLVR